MKCANKENYDEKLYKDLKADCAKCFGFCCAALYFSASEGFPANKEAGKPCSNLELDFKCSVHKELMTKGLKGCIAYDCFGAGQKVAQCTYDGRDWRKNPETVDQMFEVFLVMHQLHEMLWYLSDAIRVPDSTIQNEINKMINETQMLTKLDADHLSELNIDIHRNKVNVLLSKASEIVRREILKGQKTNFKVKKTIAGRPDFIGRNLQKVDLRGADLRGAFLIAANLRGADLSGADLIGADLRDTDIGGANLTESMFITQMQINAAKGDLKTKLPSFLNRPLHWKE